MRTASSRQRFSFKDVLAGSLAAFGYNMSVFYFTLVASALAVMVATNLLKAHSAPLTRPRTRSTSAPARPRHESAATGHES